MDSQGADRTRVRCHSIHMIPSGLGPGFRKAPDRASRRHGTRLASIRATDLELFSSPPGSITLAICRSKDPAIF